MSKFELNPLDNKKDINLNVLFRDISGQFSGHLQGRIKL